MTVTDVERERESIYTSNLCQIWSEEWTWIQLSDILIERGMKVEKGERENINTWIFLCNSYSHDVKMSEVFSFWSPNDLINGYIHDTV